MIRIQVHKTFGDSFSLDLRLSLPSQSFIALTGPSGAGKTTLLRMLAGLSMPDSGTISFGDQLWFDDKQGISLQPGKRNVGFVFQDYALFPNMTVRKNLEFALDKNADTAIVNELLDRLGVMDFADRKPDTLSGGQKQRVALGRALVRKPSLLLLDEPLAALDPELRQRMQTLLLELHRSYQLTTLMVSHDPAEIIRLADEILILEGGKLKTHGKPSDLFGMPAHNNELVLEGRILRIQPSGDHFRVDVLIADRFYSFEIPQADAPGLTEGCKVKIISPGFHPKITLL